jgi:beta-1,4-mannosyltransferase
MRILAWPAYSNRKSNPYQARLYSEISRDHLVRDIHFRLRDLPAVLFQRFDILHVHWLERVLWGRSASRIPARVLCFVAFTWLLRRKGTRLVWTVHDPEPHSMAENDRLSRGLLRFLWPRYERFALASIDGLILLSPSHVPEVVKRYPRFSSLPHTVVPHSHYRDLYDRSVPRTEARRRIGLDGDQFNVTFIGKIRPYKNVEGLIASFREFPDADARLHIAGEPDSETYAASLQSHASADQRTRLVLEFVPDDDLQLYLHAADVVVLPFSNATNSGSVLLVLSFDCPVAVPDIPVFRELRQIVGPDWIYLFDGPLTSGELGRIRSWVTAVERPKSPPLERLDWSRAASQTVAFYERLRGDPSVRPILTSELGR